MSRPYIHKFDNNGYTEEEERLNGISCLEKECALWVYYQRIDGRSVGYCSLHSNPHPV